MAESLPAFMRRHMCEAWEDLPFGENVSQIAAASVVKELRAARPADGGWMPAEPNVHLRAACLSYLASALSEDAGGADPRDLDYVGPYALRLARLWESLARLNEKTPRGHALLSAACSYELAGYQASAACLSRIFERERRGDSDPDLRQAISLFLQRRFVELRRICARLTAEPDYDKVDDMAHALGQAAAASALSSLGALFLSGTDGSSAKDAAGAAKKALADAGRLLSGSGYYQESVLLHGVRSLVGPMMSRSTWNVLGDRTRESRVWERYLMLLARGLGDDIPASRSVSDVWPSQREVVDGGLLDPSASKVVGMPAGSGRARIAEMSMLHALASAEGSKCVYVASYHSQVPGAVEALSRVFPDLGYSVSGMDGSYDDNPSEGCLMAGADIMVMTPEKLDLTARVHPERLGGVALFVLDEGRVIGDPQRGLKVEMLMTRLRRRFGKARMIVLSAMISDRTMRDIAAWLCGRGDNAIRTEWRPTLQRHARFEWSGDAGSCMLTYEGGGDGVPLPEIRIRDVIRRECYGHVDSRGGRLEQSFTSASRDETAAELAFRYSSLGPVLVYAATRQYAMSVAKKLLRRVELTERPHGDMPEHFRHRQLGDPARSVRAAREWLGPDHDMTRLLERGIAVHHGGIPGGLRQMIEADVRGGRYSAIVATDALSRGANTPIRTVVVHSCRRYDDRTEAYERIPPGEYWNLGGRAGRAGSETEGAMVHLIKTPPDRADYDYYRRLLGELSDMDGRLYELHKDLADKKISGGGVDRAIDAEVLGMLAEEGIEGGCAGAVGDIVSGTLAASKAAANCEDIGAVRGRFQAVASDTARLGAKLVRAYGGTGLGSNSCEAIRSHIGRNKQAVARLLHSEFEEDLAALVLEVLDTMEDLPEMAGDYHYDGDRNVLVRMWLGGAPVSDMFEASGAGGRDAHALFIGEIFGGLAPWGITAFLRIAAAVDGLDAGSLPPRVAHLSEMVKYGVPSPRAAWAVRLGVPDRGAAIKMAADCPDAESLGDLAQWLAGIGIDDLDRRYGLGPDSAAVAQAVRRARPNPLVRRGCTVDDVLAMGADVKCVAYGDGPAAAARAPVGHPLTLGRAYSEPDRNAIAVYTEGSLVGHVEHDVAQYLAPLIDCGASFSARIDGARTDAGGPATIRIRMGREDPPPLRRDASGADAAGRNGGPAGPS